MGVLWLVDISSAGGLVLVNFDLLRMVLLLESVTKPLTENISPFLLFFSSSSEQGGLHRLGVFLDSWLRIFQ